MDEPIKQIKDDLLGLGQRLEAIEQDVRNQPTGHTDVSETMRSLQQDLSSMREELSQLRGEVTNEVSGIKSEFGRLDFYEEKLGEITVNMVDVDELRDEFITGHEAGMLIENFNVQSELASRVLSENRVLKKRLAGMEKDISKTVELERKLALFQERLDDNVRLNNMGLEVKQIKKVLERIERVARKNGGSGEIFGMLTNGAGKVPMRSSAKAGQVPGRAGRKSTAKKTKKR
ncbi:MAG: hypothetical protein ABIC95_07030 [archaeon]